MGASPPTGSAATGAGGPRQPQEPAGGQPPASGTSKDGPAAATPPPLPPHLGTPGGQVAPAEAKPPEEYIDPISQELMLDPVLLVETGQSYERGSIEAWFARCANSERPCTDPLTCKVLRHTTLVPNYALKSLIGHWARQHRIEDLQGYSKAVGRQRTMGRRGTATAEGAGPGGRAAAEAALTAAALEAVAAVEAMQLGGGGSGGDTSGTHSSSPAAGPAAATATAQAAGPATPAAAATPAVRSAQLRRYPSMRHPAPPLVGKRQQAEAALAALREAANASRRSSGSILGEASPAARGAAAYHAWSLMQLAAEAEGRQLLWENNAIPLAIYMLGQQQQEQQQDADLDAAQPALCATLQRLAANDPEVAASIVQCGGVQVLVSQLTHTHPELRAAAARALYFLGWQGAYIRAGMLEGLCQLAAACRLPPKPLMAFWRFWEEQQKQGQQEQQEQQQQQGLLQQPSCWPSCPRTCRCWWRPRCGRASRRAAAAAAAAAAVVATAPSNQWQEMLPG